VNLGYLTQPLKERHPHLFPRWDFFMATDTKINPPAIPPG
jgi:hypothetical protein